MASPSPSENAIPFDPTEDHFSILGLSRRYTVDRDQLEAKYLELAAIVHPDRFVGADSAAQRAAKEASSALNIAYRVLRDPVQRAEYLVKLGGIDLDSSDEGGAPPMDEGFLMDMIERREYLAEARSRGPERVASLRDQVEDEAEEILDKALGNLDQGDTEAAARCLVRRRYLQRLIDEIDG